jgi:hypothetical protein
MIGAHYDTHRDSPGANDNGSAVAVLLELARDFARQHTARSLRFVAFTNEESPFTRRKAMGSRVYASEFRQRRDNIVGMICLETIGCYSKKSGQWLSLEGCSCPGEETSWHRCSQLSLEALLRQVSGTWLRRPLYASDP